MNNQANERRGIVLLVVLGMLAFLSVLVVTYVVFTSRSRQSAFEIANSEYRKPQHRELLDGAMMQLLRGTSTSSHPFYGEDLLSDVFGRTGAVHIGSNSYDTLSVLPTGEYNGEGRDRGVLAIGDNFVKIPYTIPAVPAVPPAFGQPFKPPKPAPTTAELDASELALDDTLAGRIVTFNEGPLKDLSFRILRSTGNRTAPPELYANRYSIYLELDPQLEVVLGDNDVVTIGELLAGGNHAVAALFYSPGSNGVWGNSSGWAAAGWPGTDDVAYSMHLNPAPLNGLGIGYDQQNLDHTVKAGPPASTLDLPAAFQPKGGANKHTDHAAYGDFDEPYDAPDFQNYFLAHRYTDASGNLQIIPSFHRPALINYLANQYDLSAISDVELRQLIIAVDQATFRPIPWQELPAAGNPAVLPARPPSHPRFTGGNQSFALRSPNLIWDSTNANHIARLDQLLAALIQGPWDVDNDGDGVPDSVWVDLGLPLITSPEGKLLRPMVAALIEDTGGRLNLNAHGNLAQVQATYHGGIAAPWGGTTTANAAINPFRGLGYGPAEIFLPSAGEMSTGDALFSVANRNALLRSRYAEGLSPLPAFPTAGAREHDLLDRILTGTRPNAQTWTSGRGFSSDPWGRGGLGASRSGRLYAGVSGDVLQALNLGATPPQPQVDETLNDPYETDPTGQFTGDSPYSWAEFAALMRNVDWDSDVLPNRLRDTLAASLTSNPELYRQLTTRSVSLDVPPAIRPEGQRGANTKTPVDLTTVLMERLGLPFTTAAERNAARANFPLLVGPELALGSKLDVNRPLGNGVDDTQDNDGVVELGEGVVDEPSEVVAETVAFPAAAATDVPASVRTSYGAASPNYNFSQPVTGRQLLARNLYVLMLAFSGDGYEFPMRDSSVIVPANTKIDAYRARKLAQWAVNVVDYRDQDAIMTYFPYDPHPFDTAGWVPTEAVWGVESPELVFQESLALHDVRVKDTKLENDNTGNLKGEDPITGEDLNTDSIRMPQGSLFLELYSPRARVGNIDNAETQVAPVAAPPKELYTYDSGLKQYVLDLARTAPRRRDANGNPVGAAAPVWRIAITKPHYVDAPGYPAGPSGEYPANNKPEDSDPEVVRTKFKDTASFELADPEELDVTNTPERLGIDRVVLFQDFATIADANAVVNEFTDVSRPQQVFFNINGMGAGLLPEQYLVLAPRTTTHLGSQKYPQIGPAVAPSQQKFELATAGTHIGISHTNPAGEVTTPNTNDQTQPALPLVIAAASEYLATANGGNWASAVDEIATKLPEGIGLNVSEPLPGTGYYPEPNYRLDSTNAEYPWTDAYADLSAPTPNNVADNPVDLATGAPLRELTEVRTGQADPDEPFVGVQERFCSAFLQRLADPTLPYQNDPSLPNYNPYRSVDWISIDLTVFSGEEDESKLEHPDAAEYAHDSRQRNGKDADGNSSGILYSYATEPLTTGPLNTAAGVQDYFSVNYTGAIDPADGMYKFAIAQQTLNHLNAGFGAPIAGPNRGLPSVPFALHEWLNRPFATPYELLMVPATSQGRLFEEFTTALAANPYDPGTVGPAATSLAEFKAPFGHLLNFFQADEDEDKASQFYRVLDYLDTRPPFRGEVDLVNPARLQPSSGTNAVDIARNQFVNAFQAPFNFFSDNRREGEINLNTIADYSVWVGLMFGHLTPAERMQVAPGVGPFAFGEFRASRRGYVPSGTGVRVVDKTGVNPPPYNYAPTALDPKYPTEFAGVYKPNAAAGLAPVVRADPDALRRTSGGASKYSPVDAGLLRRGSDPTKGSLFVRATGGEVWRNPDRNAFFRYQTLMRMPNLVTEQSHVYSVRLTLGYFEVDPATNSTGAEYKADLGQNERYQATFIIDRSVPVAYEPGKDRNVRNTILYQRIAE